MVERAFNTVAEWHHHVLTGGLPPLLREGIIPVTEGRRQGSNALTRICGCGGFVWPSPLSQVCSKDNPDRLDTSVGQG